MSSAPPAVSAAATRPAARPRVRYVGIDLARFIAIVGMMAAHLLTVNRFIPTASEFDRGLADGAEVVTNGTAAALFAVLGGLSMVFATRRLLREGRTGSAIGAIMVRGVVLIVIGLLLGLIENGIVVVLAYYGVAMILVAPFIAAPGWVLASVATVLGLGGAWFNAVVRRSLEVVVEGKSVSFELLFADPVGALRALLLTGEYPAITWCVYLLVGVLVGRALVSATGRGALGRAAAVLGAAGVALTVFAQLVSNWALANLSVIGVGSGAPFDETLAEQLMAWNFGAPPFDLPGVQLLAIPHSGTVFDLLRTIGISFAVIGVLVWLCDREGVAGRAPGRVLGVLRATGAAPLTVYTLHIIVSGLLMGPYRDPEVMMQGMPWWAQGPGAFALQLGGALLLGAFLAAAKRRGPLEALLSRIVGLVIR